MWGRSGTIAPIGAMGDKLSPFRLSLEDMIITCVQDCTEVGHSTSASDDEQVEIRQSVYSKRDQNLLPSKRRYKR